MTGSIIINDSVAQSLFDKPYIVSALKNKLDFIFMSNNHTNNNSFKVNL